MHLKMTRRADSDSKETVETNQRTALVDKLELLYVVNMITNESRASHIE